MNPTTPRISLIALSQPLLPRAEAVAEQLAERFPDAPTLTGVSETEGGVTFSVGDATGNYTLIDRPIPWEQIEGPCDLAWYWPEATEVMRGHQQHLFLTLVDEAGAAIDRAILHTQVTVALAATSPSVGLVWAPSVTVHNPADFTVVATKMSAEDLPLQLWIDFRVSQRDDGDLMLFTTGMESLGARELEVERYTGEPNQLAGAVYNIAHYLLEQKAVLKQGEGIGLPDGGRVEVSVGPSMVDPSLEVTRLAFE
ncbi:MAG: DUF4261 domain-containing protein [Planctomycetota bacterium]